MPPRPERRPVLEQEHPDVAEMEPMKLKILLPHQVLLEEPTTKIVAEAENGSFGLLPHHVDFVAALRPGLLSFLEPESNRESFVAVGEGLLVKEGLEVLVSARQAVRGGDLGSLRDTVRNEFRQMTQLERKTRSAMARLEASLARRFIDIQRDG